MGSSSNKDVLIYVENLPTSVKESELIKHFSLSGMCTVQELKVQDEAAEAVLMFKTNASAASAKLMNGSSMNGKRIAVSDSPFSGKEDKRQPGIASKTIAAGIVKARKLPYVESLFLQTKNAASSIDQSYGISKTAANAFDSLKAQTLAINQNYKVCDRILAVPVLGNVVNTLNGLVYTAATQACEIIADANCIVQKEIQLEVEREAVPMEPVQKK